MFTIIGTLNIVQATKDRIQVVVETINADGAFKVLTINMPEWVYSMGGAEDALNSGFCYAESNGMSMYVDVN